MLTMLPPFVAVLVATSAVNADDPKALVEEVIRAAGGRAKLPKIIRWKETWYLGDSASPNSREAIVAPPSAWYQDGRDIAAGNPDRAEKAYLVWVWSLAALAAPDSALKPLAEAKLAGRAIVGVRLSRPRQKDIDVYFDKETKRLARIDWRDYQIDFAVWKEADGFKYPAKAFVRRRDGKLHLRTEFQLLQRLPELPKELK